MNIITLLIVSALLLTTGCTKLGPDYTQIAKPKFPSSWDTNLSKNDTNIKEWWKIFNDETLNTLVLKTYKQNLDLRSAGLRILQARAALGISEGFTYPQAQTLSGSLAGVRQSANNFLSTGVNFDVGWEMDVWGKYARNIESSEATLYASIASYDDILVTLIAEVARNYINYTTAQERIAYAKSNIAIQEKVTQMTEVQFNAGNVSELDIQQAKTQLFTTKALVPALRLSQIQSRNALAILLALLPSEIDTILEKKSTLKLTNLIDYKNIQTYIPVASLDENFKIDANQIQRRPDIQIAELQARAQNARIGSAEAELYPHFSLFGSIGFNTNNATNNWISGSDAIGVSVGPSFSWNIFQYGRIKNQVRIQDAKFQESLNNYNKKILLSISEISNAMNGYALTKEQLELNKQTIEASVRAYEISMLQYNNGMVDYQRLLSTVEKLIHTEDSYAQNKGAIALQIILLYKALGGGWQINQDKSFLHQDDISAMDKRTD